VSEKKNQHYVPIVLQNGFLDLSSLKKEKVNPYLWIKEKNLEAYNKSPENIGFVKHLYTKQKETLRDYDIEDNFSIIEKKFGKFKSIILKDLEAINLEVFKEKNIQEWNDLICEFIWSQFKRTKSFLGFLETEFENELLSKFSIDQVKELKDQNGIRNASLYLMDQLGSRNPQLTAKSILSKKRIIYHIIKNKNASFVLSDNPSVLLNDTGKLGLLDRKIILFMPISSKVLVTFSDEGGDGFIKVLSDSRRVRSLNKLSASNADRFILGRDKALVESLGSYIGSSKNERRVA
jgi:hypothetical protein